MKEKERQRAMKNRVRTIAMGILLAVFLVSTALMLRQFRENAHGEAAYDAALEIAMEATVLRGETAPVAGQKDSGAEPANVWKAAAVEGDPVMEEMAGIHLAALQAENADVVGWLRIPDTKIDYPLMQGQDNEFYLNHTWQKEPNSVGSVFLEHLNDPALTDYNTIVYGHNMNNGSMFAELELFALKSFWEEHPYVYVAIPEGVYRYEIFAFFEAEVDSLTYGMNPQQEETKAYILHLAEEKARFDTGIRPAVTDRILTLSTCSGANYDFRYVVQARLPMVKTAE